MFDDITLQSDEEVCDLTVDELSDNKGEDDNEQQCTGDSCTFKPE